jgi:hypothetical protein
VLTVSHFLLRTATDTNELSIEDGSALPAGLQTRSLSVTIARQHASKNAGIFLRHLLVTYLQMPLNNLHLICFIATSFKQCMFLESQPNIFRKAKASVVWKVLVSMSWLL